MTILKIFSIIIILIFILLYLVDKIAGHIYTWDYADVLFAKPFKTFKVKSYKEIQDILRLYPDKPVSLAGGKFSHGGQTFCNDCLYIDITALDEIISLNKDKKILSVQAGITWRKVLEYLDQYNLSVKAMQSYANFTVGGAISVNAHGRGIEYSTVGSTLLGLKIMLMDGTILDVFPGEELFRAVLGGYGGIAIILEATLSVTDNYLMCKTIIPESASTENIFETFQNLIANTNDVALYNGLIYPENRTQIYNTYYQQVNTNDNHMNGILCKKLDKLQDVKPFYLGSMLLEQLLRRSTIVKYCRAYFEPWLNSFDSDKPEQKEEINGISGINEITGISGMNNEVMWRNWELSYDANKLGAILRFPTTTVLQEYFIPINKKAISQFFEVFNKITADYSVNLLNISLRYVRSPDMKHLPILDYAPEDRLAIVIYYNIYNNPLSLSTAGEWTQKVLDTVIKLGGSYYLPYLPLARIDQFREAYPQYHRFLAIKKKYDPMNRLRSCFIDTYLIADSL